MIPTHIIKLSNPKSNGIKRIFHWKFFFEESYPHLPQILCGSNICSKPIKPIFSQITHCFVPIPLKFACETDKVSVCHHTFQYHSTAPQQAAKCPGATSRRGISPLRHSSVANGQRTANRHPGFGLTGLVTSPCKSSLFL